MFTPQKWSNWSHTPKSGDRTSVAGSGADGSKGKGIAFAGDTTLGSDVAIDNGGNGSADRDGLAQRIALMENELFEYQYSMGLLLIEKKEWTSKYEELKRGLEETQSALKREQTSHLIAITDVEKREENLRKALGVEKQCVFDLEKALREIRAENAEIKYSAESKLAEANALVTSIEEKSLELEAKLRSADAKLAEVSRKSSEIGRKSQDLEARENASRRDRLSLVEEQKAHEAVLSKQREELREWERKLQEGEERLAKGQLILNQREERSSENDRVFKKKQKDLEDAQKKTDELCTALRSKEDDINSRIANLTVKEKEYDALKVELEMKEEELRLKEEKLHTRETVELQKLTDEHNAVLEAKKHAFELEMEQKRNALDEELKNKVVDVEKKEAEINHMEEKLVKREQALEKRLEKFREKEKDYEGKVKALKEREKLFKTEEKDLEKQKNEILADREELLKLTTDVEKIKAENEEKLQSIIEETDRLKVTEEDRSNLQRLQSELKQEIDKYMLQKELVLKEAEDLKQEKEVFEREWEVLDERRAEIEKELRIVNEQKADFEKLKQTEEERLRNEREAVQETIKREQEDLKLVQDSFASQMEHEKSLMAGKAESERTLMLHDFETRKSQLEADMQRQFEELEKPLREKEKSFEEEKKKELDNITYVREVARREMDELKFERHKVEKERQEANANKEHLESQRVEIRKDIDDLFALSGKLKDQREQFIKERERFIAFVEKLKGCSDCGETISEFALTDLQSLAEIENAEVLPLPNLADYALAASQGQNSDLSPPANSKSPLSGGKMSWLRKCTSIFKLSPGKKADEPSSGEKNFVKFQSTEIEAELSFAGASDSYDVQAIQSNTSVRETEAGQDPSADVESNLGQKKSRRKGKANIGRSRSVKAVVEDAKAILGDDFEELNESGYQNGNVDESEYTNAEERGVARRTRKRVRSQASQVTASEQEGGESEGRSDTVVEGRPKRRRGKAPSVEQPSVGRRYNLRRPKSEVAAPPAKSSLSKEKPKQVGGKAGFSSNAGPATSVGVTSENFGSTQVLVRCSTVAETEDGYTDAMKTMTETTALSEEVNGTPERAGEFANGDEYQSESRADDTSHVDEDDDEADDEDEESLLPGEASMGKKLWKFLTT